MDDGDVEAQPSGHRGDDFLGMALRYEPEVKALVQLQACEVAT